MKSTLAAAVALSAVVVAPAQALDVYTEDFTSIGTWVTVRGSSAGVTGGSAGVGTTGFGGTILNSFSIAAGTYQLYFDYGLYMSVPDEGGVLSVELKQGDSLLFETEFFVDGVDSFTSSVFTVGALEGNLSFRISGYLSYIDNAKIFGTPVTPTPVTPVPGPIAGAGLPLLAAGIAFAAWRRRRAANVA